jgi:oligoribonuclease NrnB/cAMP/cGMP phosphodiesterase (DHH superfamily)
MFPNEAREYKIYLIDRAIELLKDGYIALDERLYFIKKEFLKIDKNDTLDNLSSHKIVELLTQKKEDLTIYYQDKKALLTYMIGGVSIIANEFLKRNSDFHFVMDLNFKGTVGFRANNEADVSKIAKELLDGGGHPNASGGRFKKFQEFYNYDSVKRFVVDYISKV